MIYYGITDTRRPAMEPIERVEILMGPGALLYGISPFGNVGGKRMVKANLMRLLRWNSETH